MKRTKKVISLVLIFALVLSMSVVTAFATDEVKVTAETKTAQKGDTVSLNVTITENPGFTNGTVSVTWPKASLLLTKVENTNVIPGWSGEAVPEEGVTSGTYNLAWKKTETQENILTTGVVCTLTFKVLENATLGDKPISLASSGDALGFANSSGNTVSSSTTDGKVTVVLPASTISITDAYEGKVYDGTAIADPTDEQVSKNGSTGDITFEYFTDAACETKTTVGLNGASAEGTAPKNVGDYWVKATVVADANYEAATSEAKGFKINKAAYTYDGNSIDKTTYVGAAYPSTQAVEAVGVDVSGVKETVNGSLSWFTDAERTTAATGTFQTAGTQKLYWTFTPEVAATNYATAATNGETEFNVQAKQSVTVTFDNATSKDYSGSEFVLGELFTAASVDGGKQIARYEYNGKAYSDLEELKAVKVTDAGTYTVKAIYESETEYGEATATFTINKVDQTALTMTSANSVSYGTDLNLTSTGGSSDAKVRYEIVTDASMTGAANISDAAVLTPTKVGKVKVKAIKAGNTNYNAVESAAQEITIDAKEVTITGLQAENKEYDGNTTATTTGGTISGLIEGDKVTIKEGTAKFADKNVGENKDVTFTGYDLEGTDKDNYSLSAQPAAVKANITAKSVTITGISAEHKVFDGNKTAAVKGLDTAQIKDLIAGDTVSIKAGTAQFASEFVGTDVNVTFSGFSLEGDDAANYSLSTQPADVNADITAKAQTITIDSTADKKVTRGGTVNVSQWATSDAPDATLRFTIDGTAEGVRLTEEGMLSVASTVAAGMKVTIKVNAAAIHLNSDSKAEYTAAAEQTMEITVASQTEADVTIQQVPTGNKATFGDSFTLKATAANTEDGGTWKWTVDNTAFEIISGSDTDTLVVKAKAATASAKGITATYNSTQYLGTKTETITVDKRVITVTAEDKEMTVNGKLPEFTVVYGNLPEGVSSDSIFATKASASVAAGVDGKTTGTFDISITAPTLTEEAAKNYEIATPVAGKLTVKPAGGSSSGGGYYPYTPTTPSKPSAPGLDSAKKDSNAALSAAVAGNKYDAAEQAEVKKIMDKAAADIKNAKTEAEVKAIQEAAEKELDQILTTEEKEIIAAVESVEKGDFKTKSKAVKRNGKKVIKLTWNVPEDVQFDGFEIYRSTKKNSGYGTEPFFTTTKTSYTNTKNLKAGKTYYYKVRAFVVINGEKVYTEYSLKAWRKA